MIKVSVTSTTLRNQSGNAKATGKPYNMDFQNVWMFLFDRDGQPDPHPTKVEVILEHDKNDGAAIFYPVGEYLLHPSSIYVNRDGDLAVAPRLHPVRPVPKTAA